MKAKKNSNANRKTRAVSVRPSSPHHRLDTLLHTMRCIAQYEDVLCELSHELKRSGSISEEASEELHEILEKIPGHDYLADLESVKAILAIPGSSQHLFSKKRAKTKAVRKSPIAAKKKPGRKSSR